MYFVYILENEQGTLYIGQAKNFDDRLFRHNQNRVKATKNKGPWKTIHREKFLTRSGAIKRERYLKSLKNPRYIKQRIILG
ncbi:MAG: GIY-YIG nuclease family protein [Candidatus Doudnabacteria bacterium]|nr:GIY-YIG nuclease family protein [Candidatus Doudnabacteria bacterium]